MSDSDQPAHNIVETADDAGGETGEDTNLAGTQPPVLSPNPATNALIADIVLRGVSKLSRETVEAVLGVKPAKDSAGEEPTKPSLVFSLAAMGATKLATKSLPGFAIVSTGLVAKTLFDRSQRKRKARREEQKALQERADPDSGQ